MPSRQSKRTAWAGGETSPAYWTKKQRKDKRCCAKGCTDTILDSTLKTLRSYIVGLPSADADDFLQKRRLWKQGMQSLDAEDLYSRRAYTCHIEKPDVLVRKVAAIGAGPLEAFTASSQGNARLDEVRPGELVECCTFFLVHHICGFSDSKLRSSRHMHPVARTAEERDLTADRQRRPYERASPKEASSIRWLDEAKKSHMIMPNAEKTILPHATHAHAHADMVHDLERTHRCSWADDALFDYYQEQMESEIQEENRRSVEGLRERERGRAGTEAHVCEPASTGASCSCVLPDASDEEKDGDAADEPTLGAGMGQPPHRGPDHPLPGVRCRCVAPPDDLGGGADEDQAIDDAMDDMSGAGMAQSPKRSEYRYGNPLLGKREGGHEEHSDIPSLSWFLKVWKLHRPELKIRKWLPFAKCDDCIELRGKVMKTRDQQNKRKLLEELRQHLRFVKRERLAYAVHRRMGIEQPQEYLSIIIDGADQSDHDLPHHHSKSHATDAAWKLKLHLMGVLVHGRGSFAYTCPAHLAQGHNVTIQALVDTLVALKKKPGAQLPPCLLLQLDNTTKQCKGKYLMAFLALLVEEGVFKKVIVSFLPVGHTHEDIDQFFSRIAKQLRMYTAYARQELALRIRKGYHKYGSEPWVRHWDNVANISGWLDQHGVATMTDITAHHQFRLFRTTSTGTVQMQGRRWPGGNRDDHWSGLNSNKMFQPLFKDDCFPSLLDTWDTVPPAARPTHPPTEDTIKKTRDGLDALYRYLPGMTQEAKSDCDALFDLYATPVEVDINFAWSRADIELLFSTPDAAAADGQVVARATAMDGTNPKVADFYLVRPAVINADGSHPFHLVMIKLVSETDAALRVMHMELAAEDQNAEKPDWCGGHYVPSKGSEPGTQIANLPFLSFSNLQCRVDVRSASGQWRWKFAQGAKGKSLAAWWALRFQGPSLSLVSCVCAWVQFMCVHANA